MPRSKKNRPKDNLESKSIGQRVAYFRKMKGMTQKDLAEKIGINRSLVTDYEIGRARIYDEMVAKIAVTLDVSADTLLGIESELKEKESPSLRVMKRINEIEKLPDNQKKILLRNIDLNLAGFKSEEK